MNVTRKVIVSSVVWVLASLGGLAWAEDVPRSPSLDEMMKIMAEVGKPGPEHAKLDPMAGNWTYTGKFWLDPAKPAVESHGTIERKWVLGGRFLEEKVDGTGFDGKHDFEGLALIGFDNAQRKYTVSFVSNMGTGTSSGVGEVDASGKHFTFHTQFFCPVRKKVVHARDEVRIENNDKVVLESYEKDDGKEAKTLEMVTLRKK